MLHSWVYWVSIQSVDLVKERMRKHIEYPDAGAMTMGVRREANNCGVDVISMM